MKEYKLNFLHLCDFASLSNNKLNALGIFSKFNFSSLPGFHPMMFVVANFTVEKKGTYKITVRIKNKDDKGPVLIDREYTVVANKENDDLGVISQIVNLEFDKYGKYIVQILINDVIIGEKEFEVIK